MNAHKRERKREAENGEKTRAKEGKEKENEICRKKDVLVRPTLLMLRKSARVFTPAVNSGVVKSRLSNGLLDTILG